MSGQAGLLQDGKIIAGGIREQTEQTIQNIQAVLSEAGLDLSSVVKTTCYLTNIDDFSVFNECYAKYFTHKPARSCLAVKDIAFGLLCEIEVIAYAGGGKK